MGEHIPEWAQEIRERVVRIETKLDSSADTREKAEAADNLSRANKERLDRIEANQSWLWRTLLGGLMSIGITILYSIIRHIGGF